MKYSICVSLFENTAKKQPNLLDLTSLILTKQCFGLLYLILLSFSQASKESGMQVLTKSFSEFIDKIVNENIFFSAEIDH